MAMRVTGSVSGMDTESIIQELVAVRQTKVDDLKKAQTKLEWKQESWKELNSKVYKLYNGTLSNLRFQSSFSKKATTASNTNLVSVTTGDDAMDSVQTLEINKLATAGYLTGKKISDTTGNALTSGSSLTDKLGIAAGSKFEVTTGGKTTQIEITEGMTISDLVSKLKETGVKANFDATNQRLFIGASGTGKGKDFSLVASNADGADAISKLGIFAYDETTKAAYQTYANLGSDATAKQAAIQKRADALLAGYTSEKNTLTAEIEELNKTNESVAEAYSEDYAASGTDLTDETQRTDRKQALNDKISELTAKLEDDTLTDSDKAIINTDLNAAKGELSFITGYENNLSTINGKQARIDTIDSTYASAAEGSQIWNDASAEIETKIAQADAYLGAYNTSTDTGAVRINGSDAEIVLNGATFTSDTNTLTVNGLTINCKGQTNGEVISLTTQNDTSGIYDMVKSFIKEYSELINEIDKLYNADSAKGYEPLTDDDKDSMSDTEVEKWETKIKDALLRRDSNLSTVASTLKDAMSASFDVDGTKTSLLDFGIETLNYFLAADNEKSAYHINGDADDTAVKNETNKLQEMIATDPDKVTNFFTQLAKNMYSKLGDMMSTTDYRSINTIYDDKRMKEEYSDFTKKIKEEEADLQAYEDKWYNKFSAMEVAMSKMQSNQSAIAGLLGG